ncbi:MAG: hypothetical protein KIC76_02740 [Firmicutes bacterium]|nr:hypothetical protein [Bacillota bacterium]
MEKINGRKLSLIFIFILILLVIALLVGKFTYSYLGPTISDDLETQGEVTASGDTLIFTKGNNLSLSATTDNFTTGGTNLTSTTNPKVKLVASTKTNQASATYYVGVLIKNNTYVYTTSGKTPELILTIKDEKGNNVTAGVNGLTYVTSGGVSGFDVTGKKGLFNIKTDYPISTTSSSAGTTHTWTFTLTFVNLGTDQSDNENASMNVDIYLQKEEYKLPLNEYVISQYTGTQGENSLYYHNSSLTNGAGDNSYRYAGASNSVNNYICLGSDEAICPDANLFRIIGVFGAQAKVIRAKSVGNKQWHSSSTPNTWSSSSLNTYLNGEYLTSLGTLADKIAITTWKVGGGTYENIGTSVPKTAYQNEVGSSASSTTYGAKIGLMYVSDYYYSASPSAWTLVGYNSSDATKDYRAAKTINWLSLGSYEWTISRNSEFTNGAFLVAGAGVSGAGYVSYSNVLSSNGVRPSFNLESSVKYVSGSGSMSDPVRIK